jgi:hypothetical protein
MKNYALKWALGYNSGYRKTYYTDKQGKKHVADCTNFISQALQAGGWAEDTGFYWDNSNWWYTKLNQSRSWGAAENWSIFAQRRTTKMNSVWSAGIADIIQFDWTNDGVMDHSMIVTGVTGNEVYISSHTNPRRGEGLSGLLRDVRKTHPNYKIHLFRTWSASDERGSGAQATCGRPDRGRRRAGRRRGGRLSRLVPHPGGRAGPRTAVRGGTDQSRDTLDRGEDDGGLVDPAGQDGLRGETGRHDPGGRRHDR